MTPTHIDYIPMSPLASAVRQSMYPTEFKGGGLKKVVAVAAMVFIPMAAPAISGAIATSGFLGASATGVFSTWAGSAIVGAGLGAVAAKATGQDWKRGALMGGIGGGIAGYSSGMGSPFGSTASSGAGAISNAQGAEMGLNALETADYNLAMGSSAATPITTAQGAEMGLDSLETSDYNMALEGQTDGFTGTISADSQLTQGLDATPISDAQGADMGLDSLETQDYNSALGGETGGFSNTTTQPRAGLKTGGTGNANQVKGGGGGNNAGPNSSTTWTEAFQKGFSKDNTMKAAMNMGGNLLSNALISNELPAEQQAQINAAQAVVDRLEAQGAEVDELKLAAAKLALRDANNISIEWLRQQKYAQAKNRGSRQTRDAVRTASAKGYNQAGMPNVYRRGGLETEKAASTAGEQAALGAYDTRGKLFAQANSMFPTSTGTTGYRTSMQSIWDADAKRKEEERKAYGNVWAGLTGQGIS